MNENRSSLAVPIVIILAILIVGGAFYYQSQNPSKAGDSQNASSTTPAELSQLIPPAEGVNVAKFRPIDTTDKVLGSATAPVKLVVYTDLECPACKYFHQQLKAIEGNYVSTGQVAIVYREFPLDQIHPKARTEFLAAECVNEVGGAEKFYQFVDKIFEITPANNGLDPAKLGETAKALGVDIKTFESCMKAQKYAANIGKSVDEAIALGAPGTPTSILVDTKGNLIPMTVALPADRLSAIFDLLLGTAPKTPEATTSPAA